MVFLALRKTPPSGVFQRAFFYATKIRLLTAYPHAGVLVGDTLLETTLLSGPRKIKFVKDGWDLFRLPINSDTVMHRFDKVQNARYDWISLIGFVLPWRVSKSNWFYCYELALYLMNGTVPNFRVTPEKLLSEVYRGKEEGKSIG